MIEIKFSGEQWSKLRLEIQEFAVTHLNLKFNGQDIQTGFVAKKPGRPKKAPEPELAAQDVAEEQVADYTEPVISMPKVSVTDVNMDEGVRQAEALVRDPKHPRPPEPTTILVKDPKDDLIVAPMNMMPATPVDLKACLDILTEVHGKFGMEEALKQLLPFGVNRVSLLKPEHFAEFHKSCVEKLA